MDIYDNINNKNYEIKDEYPTKPRPPAILNQTAFSLTNEQLAAIPAIKEEYDKALNDYEKAIDSWRKKERELEQQYESDLFEYCKMDLHHPFARKLFSVAWDTGHSNGHYEVAQIFESLVDDLFECAVKHGMHRHVVKET